VHSETDASLAFSGNCRHWATGLGGRQAAHSRPSDRRRRTPDGRACCDDIVYYDEMVTARRSKSLTTGNVRCGVAAIHEVLGSLALETPVNCHSELTEDSLVDSVQRVAVGARPCAQSRGQAKKASVSSWDFVWNCHSLIQVYTGKYRIHCDHQLTCFKRRRAQLLFEANRISRLICW